VDPNSFESGSGISSESGYWIRIQGFDDQKLKKKKIQLNFFLSFFGSKIALYLCPGYRRSLNPQKRTSSTSKNEIY
jgi:hypothetical protein